MNFYLDDDSASDLMAKLLRKAGDDVIVPHDVGYMGKDDSEHLAFAVRAGRIFITKNHGDFAKLHDLVQAVGGRHRGILVICQENNPKRDLSPKAIVAAIRKLMAAGIAIPNELIILNEWR